MESGLKLFFRSINQSINPSISLLIDQSIYINLLNWLHFLINQEPTPVKKRGKFKDSFKKGKRADSIFPIYFQQPGTRKLGSPSCCSGDDHCQVTIDMKKEKSKKSSPLSFKFPGWVSFYWIPPLSPSPPWPSSTPWRDYALLPPTSPPAPTSPSATHFPGVLFRLTLNLNSPLLQQCDISWKMFKN